jgi:hypothetical protein
MASAPPGEVYNEESGTATKKVGEKPGPVGFQPLDAKRADDLFTALPNEAKWGHVTATLLAGNAVFVPHMTRNQLESLRTIVNRRSYGRLRSRITEVDDVPGRVVRVQRRAGA